MQPARARHADKALELHAPPHPLDADQGRQGSNMRYPRLGTIKRFVERAELARPLHDAPARTRSMVAAASSCIVGVTCEYTSSVSAIVA